jgi:putative transposase
LTHQVVKDHASLFRKFETENEALKLLLAEKELESRLKDDLLKKKYPELRKRH